MNAHTTLNSALSVPARPAAMGLTCLILLSVGAHVSAREDDLRKQASWSSPDANQIEDQLNAWIDRRQLEPAQRRRAIEAFRDQRPRVGILGAVTAAMAAVDERVQAIQNVCQSVNRSDAPSSFSWLSDDATDPFAAANLSLMYGRWLIQNAFYDEGMQHLETLAMDQVVDPASLLFYRGVAHHRLLNKEACLADLKLLLENEDAVPNRFLAVAKLMAADIRPLQEDSLDEISRLMEDIQRRLALGRAGRRVRDEENDVIAKLDKMIEDIEKQQQQQQQGASGAGNTQSGSPADDSMPLGGSGPGDVDQRSIGDAAGWGNLPPKERQEALQQISKDLPAHFREVIEEYFRKLARDGGN